jgi:hypothetical protein
MSEKPLPDAVRHLILTKIPSVLQLEILLHLYAARPRFLAIHEISSSLRIESEPLLDQLSELEGRGLAASQKPPRQAYSFATTSVQEEGAVRQLVELYRERPVTIIGLIYSRPNEKIRTLADAFRIRQEKETPNE